MTCPRINETNVKSDFKAFLPGCEQICNPAGIAASGSYPSGCTLLVRAIVAGNKEDDKP